MRNNSFNLNGIPQIDNITEEIAKDTLIDVKENYKKLICDTIEIIYNSIETISKSLILYNLFFLVEIWLKYYLINISYMELKRVEEMGHAITNLMTTVYRSGMDIEELNELLNKFRNREGNKLDFNIYHHFRYNRKLNQTDLIFEYECVDEEKERVKEVVEWIKQYI